MYILVNNFKLHARTKFHGFLHQLRKLFKFFFFFWVDSKYLVLFARHKTVDGQIKTIEIS